MPVVPATLAQSGSMMDPPDPFMMAEAEALARRFALMPDMPLTCRWTSPATSASSATATASCGSRGH